MPDRRMRDGWRDYTLLLFLYNCGVRVSEAAGLCWDDLQSTAQRQLFGKGKKERLLPLWSETANELHQLRSIRHGADRQCVFLNRHGRRDQRTSTRCRQSRLRAVSRRSREQARTHGAADAQ